MNDVIELNEHGKAIWVNLADPSRTAERSYRWVDRVIVMNGRSVAYEERFSAFDRTGWRSMTVEEYAELIKPSMVAEPATRFLNIEPSVLGYWSARHGFTLRDLMVSKFAGHLRLHAPNDREAFIKGQEQYEAERRVERMKAMFDDLEAAYDPDQASAYREKLERLL